MKLKNGLIIITSLLIFLIIVGFLWRSYDLNNIRGIDYHMYFQRVMQYNTVDPVAKAAELRDILSDNYMYIIEESQPGMYEWRYIGFTGRTWLTAGYVQSIVIVARPTGQPDESKPTIWELSVLSWDLKTGSMIYITILALSVFSFAALTIKREYLPHIFRRPADIPEVPAAVDEL